MRHSKKICSIIGQSLLQQMTDAEQACWAHRRVVEALCRRIHRKAYDVHEREMTMEELKFAQIKIEHDRETVLKLRASCTDEWEKDALSRLDRQALSPTIRRLELEKIRLVHHCMRLNGG